MRRRVQGRLAFIRRWLWLILLQAVLTAGAAYGFSAIQIPVYEATAELFISARSMQITALDLQPVRQDYAAYLHSTFRAQEVVDELNLDLRPVELLEKSTIRAGDEASTVIITVENSDPELAAAIARAWGRRLVATRRLENATLPVEQQIEAEQLDRVTVRLDRPRSLVNAVAGFFLGAAGGVALAFWLAWLAGSQLRNGPDVEAALGVPLMGRIPAEAEPARR